MIISECRRLRICIATLGLVAAGEAYAICPDCVPMNLQANVQVTNLHPAVTHLQLRCDGGLTAYASRGASQPVPVVNRGYAGILGAEITLPPWVLASQTNYTLNVICELWLARGAATYEHEYAMAVASAVQPVSMTDSNWAVVANGSTIKWTQAVTYPNKNAAP